MVKSSAFFLIISAMLTIYELDAQPDMSIYSDIGRNNVSDGLYLTMSISGNYTIGKTNMGFGSQFNLINHNDILFSAGKINIDRTFEIKGKQCRATIFYIYNLFSELIHDTHWGIAFNHNSKHFTYILGTNFSTSHLTRKAIEEYDINSNTRLVEKWNLMYLLGVNLKPFENRWNAGFRITNIDNFIIRHDTNPMLALNSKYRLQVPLTLFLETWYKTAGVLNISANSFGFFIRTGLLWEIY